MNGRGEFSFLLTDQARADGLLTGQQASAVIWALLIASVASPSESPLCLVSLDAALTSPPRSPQSAFAAP